MDQIRLNFNEESFLLLNFLIAYIMFGVSLTIKKEDFFYLFQQPKAIVSGLISQLILLPFFTIIIILIIQPDPLISLGMVLVSVCPGGAVSNFFSSQARANIALSISLTAIVTIFSVFITPLNFDLWSSFIPHSNELNNFTLRFSDMIKTLVLIVFLPVTIGLWVSSRFPNFVIKSSKIIKISSFGILILFVVGAFIANAEFFKDYITEVIGIVIIHNAIAFISGYGFAAIMRNKHTERKTISIETGIQNSALALIIIFNFFDANGPMSLVAATWGIWHLVVGTALSQYWRIKNRI